MRDPQSELVWQGVRGRTARRAARALPGSRSPAPGTMPHPAGSTPPSFDLKRTCLEQHRPKTKTEKPDVAGVRHMLADVISVHYSSDLSSLFI